MTYNGRIARGVTDDANTQWNALVSLKRCEVKHVRQTDRHPISEAREYDSQTGCIKSQRCLSAWFVGIVSLPAQCSNTGLKMRSNI